MTRTCFYVHTGDDGVEYGCPNPGAVLTRAPVNLGRDLGIGAISLHACKVHADKRPEFRETNDD